MESDNELKEIDIESYTCYYSNDIINTIYLDLDNSLDEKIYENFQIYYPVYATPYGAKTLQII